MHHLGYGLSINANFTIQLFLRAVFNNCIRNAHNFYGKSRVVFSHILSYRASKASQPRTIFNGDESLVTVGNGIDQGRIKGFDKKRIL